MTNQLQHEIRLDLASGAHLKILYFSDRGLRWIFSYNYLGKKDPGTAPEVVNDVKLTAEYADGLLASTLVLTMYVINPAHRVLEFFAGIDITPGSKAHLEFSYKRTGGAYRFVEICRDARDRARVIGTALERVNPLEYPFPIPNRLPVEYAAVRVPFRTNAGLIDHFSLPTNTLR
jgi:hypothetical protein